MRYLLDTPVLLDHLNGYRPAVNLLHRLFEEDAELFTCDVVVCEALSAGTDQQREVMNHLLEALDYAPTRASAAREAGDTRHAAGRKLTLADALMAATARDLEATIVTRNRPELERQAASVLTY
jgi:predicted nucleic acid-binding protein